MAAKKMEEKKSDDLIIGVKNIEDFMKKSMDEIHYWRTMFDFPLSREGGSPAVSKSAFLNWLNEWEIYEVEPTKITRTILERVARRRRIAAMENAPLVGINAICEAVHRPGHFIIDWIKQYDDCPVKKIEGSSGGRFENLQVKKRDLIQWLEANRIPWGYYMGESTR